VVKFSLKETIATLSFKQSNLTAEHRHTSLRGGLPYVSHLESLRIPCVFIYFALVTWVTTFIGLVRAGVRTVLDLHLQA